MTDKKCGITKPAKTKQKNNQKYVWRWYADVGDRYVGPYKTRKPLIDDINDWVDGEIDIVKLKSEVADLSAVVDDNFVSKTLRSMVTAVDDNYEDVKISQFFTERQQRDLAKKLKAAFAAWQSENGIAVPTGKILDNKNTDKVEEPE